MNKVFDQKNKLLIIATIILYFLLSFQTTLAYSINPQDIGAYLNQERTARNLDELRWCEKLSEAARNKAEHMIKHNYFDHYAPDGTSPWSFIYQSDYDYKFAGENLAMGFNTSKSVHDAWMASSTHRANIINSNYRDYAIHVEENIIDGKNQNIIVQIFATPDNPIISKTNFLVNTILNFILGKDSLQ